MKENTKNHGVYLPQETAAKADALAQAAGLSRSRLIRRLIEATAAVRPVVVEMVGGPDSVKGAA